MERAPSPEYRYSYALGYIQGVAEELQEEIKILEQKIAAKQIELDNARREIAHNRDMEVA